MKKTNPNISVGHHRPVYLWAGPGTIRMNRLKFMGAKNDEAVHQEAHTKRGAQRISQEAGFNWAYLMYDWGFPPKVETEDWEDFVNAVPIYQDSGIKVFGYIQASNCVYEGSYKDKEWYAKDPKGRNIHYYTGRYMTCLLNRDWLLHLQEMTDGVINAGADGVFFDNPWFGIQPIHFGGTWAGPAGCYCPSCIENFINESEFSIPSSIHPETDPISQEYIKWRANRVTEIICTLAEYARSRNPNIVICANNYDAIMHPTYISHGIDLPGLADCQDVLMIENFSLPKYQEGLFVNNALTIRTALAFARRTPLTTNPYDKGIGFDDVFPPRRIQQSIVEAAACGTALVVKGTEFFDQTGTFTLLTAEKYKPQRVAAGQIHRWLSENSNLYQNRKNITKIGLVFPEEKFKTHWDQAATLFFRLCQTLTLNGFPWRVVNNYDSWSELEIIFHFDEIENNQSASKMVYVPDLPEWEFPKPPFLTRHPCLRDATSQILSWFYRSYFDNIWTRRVLDTLQLPQWFLSSPHFKIPPKDLQKVIIQSLYEVAEVQVTNSNAPVLIEHWGKNSHNQVHVVNYGSKRQSITVSFPQQAVGEIKSPTQEIIHFSTDKVSFDLDLYAVLIYSIQIRNEVSAGID